MLVADVIVTHRDDAWYRSVVSFAAHTKWLQPIMSAYTILGLVALAVLLLVGWWLARRRGERVMAAVGWTGIGTLVAFGVGLVVKHLVAEPRPCLTMHVHTVLACPGATDYSFPSDHATIAFALVAGLWLLDRVLGLIGLVLGIIEGFSRIYLGQHYPHDVIAGAVLGVLVIAIGWLLLARALTGLVVLLARTPLRPLLVAKRGVRT